VNTLDLLIIVIVVALAAIGYAQGFIVGGASLFGLALGGLVGTRITHGLLERASEGTASAWSPIIGLGIGLLITLVGAMAMQDLGAQLRGRVQGSEMTAVDHMLGAVLLAIVGLLLAWFAAAALIGLPQLRSARPQVIESTIVRQLNSVLPDAGPLIGAISSYDPFPKFDGGSIVIDAPDGRLPSDPQVRDASRSVVRVVGSACGYRVTGSGWYVARGFVATNAHVVAGEDDTGVQVAGKGHVYQADVVSFDPINDVAVLRVRDLDMTPLTPLQDTRRGTAAVVLGYPENQGFQATAARFSDERTVKGADIYGDGSHPRRITSFRGLVRHGNSGGPIVDGDGHVVATVFAATVGEKIAGGYGVPNDIVLDALQQGQSVPSDRRVRTGRCVA
jgi:S1-C subfamily serine protease